MNIATAYSDWSPRYDSEINLTRDLDAVVTRRLAGSGPFPLVVEAGCGTGKNTRHFSQIGSAVHALDFSSGMLDLARRNVAAPNVLYREADLTSTWPCCTGAADLVSFNLVLEHIERLDAVLGEATRVLRPGGRVLVSELHPFKQYQGSQARFTTTEGAEFKVPAFTHHVSDYLRAALGGGLRLVQLDEWWHPDDDAGGAPRLLSLLFERG